MSEGPWHVNNETRVHGVVVWQTSEGQITVYLFTYLISLRNYCVVERREEGEGKWR